MTYVLYVNQTLKAYDDREGFGEKYNATNARLWLNMLLFVVEISQETDDGIPTQYRSYRDLVDRVYAWLYRKGYEEEGRAIMEGCIWDNMIKLLD